MQTRWCNYVDEPEWIPYSSVQQEDPFTISDGTSTKFNSKKLIEKIVGFIQNLESEEELLGKITMTPTIFIYSHVSYIS